MTVRSSVQPGEGLAGTASSGGPAELAMFKSAPPQQRRGRPRALAADGGWRSVAACQCADPDLFFPVSAFGKSLQQVTQAKAICADCPVRAECLAFALRTKQVHGVWGGMTEEERHLARSRRQPSAGEPRASTARAHLG